MSDSSVIGNASVWPNYSSANQPVVNSQDDPSANKDQFLKILVAQLQNQDPMSPMDDKSFITQMAQFSQVEQTFNMANELKMLVESLGSASASLIGKSVEWTAVDPDTGAQSTQSGIVDAISFKDGVQYVNVGSQQISMDQLTRIANPTAEGETSP